ncbi:TetR/AcrR family transcriptional regulator [Rhodococcus sp. SJ-3]|uniref:TetR/AcrR family transcriptional regulator n=1 Tax=Rhodococcus sp. SJ-3 TaxID=3454628 RepID=UPI003F78FB35
MATLVRREDYFDAAIELLSSDDYGALKQAQLCAHLDVTTGSFYNYFASWAQFRKEFLENWLEQQTIRLVATARLEASPVRRLELLIDFACGLPHHAESSIRGWAHTDAEVRSVQATVDYQRYLVVVEATSAILDDAGAAEGFARTALYCLVGYQQTVPLPELDTLRWGLGRILHELLATTDR